MKRYHIPADRSEDLIAQSIANETLFADMPSQSPIPVEVICPASPNLFESPHIISDERNLPRKRRKLAIFSDEDEPKPAVVHKRKKYLGDGGSREDMMPGVKRFMDTIASMEQRCKDMPVQDDDEEDSEYDDEESYSDLSEIDIEDTEEEDGESTELEEEEEPTKVTTPLRRKNALMHGFFSDSKKRVRDEDEEVEEKKVWRGRR